MTTTSGASSSYLSAQIRAELWRRIAARLANGESLVTRRQYFDAFEAAFRDFTGEDAPAEVRALLRQLIEEAHSRQPETYLAHGVQNAVQRAFVTCVERLAWDVPRVQQRGSRAVQRFLRRNRIRNLLDEIRLDPQLIDTLACVQRGVEAAQGATIAPPTPADRRAIEAEALAERARGLGVDEERVPVLQAFAGLQRIRREYDGLLKLLIRHSEHVLSSDSQDRTPLTTALLQSGSLLGLAVAAMGGKDPELRSLGQRLSPYDQVVPREPEASTVLALEEGFIDELRRTRVEDVAARLQTPDGGGLADNVGALVVLLHQLTDATPFRRKVRLLSANHVLQDLTPEIEALYREAAKISTARSNAQRRLQQKLADVLADASTEEATAVRKRAQALVMRVEQKWVDETETAAETVLNTLSPTATAPEAGAVEELSDVEISRGALLTEIAVRVGGRLSQVAGAVMPAPDDPHRFVLAQRDADSGELKPQMRRGRPRYVDRKPDGSWLALTG